MGIGNILQEYDTDKKYPVYGFGGKLAEKQGQRSDTSHCFALNGDIFNPEVFGVEGILHAYRTSIRCCPLSGPTFFKDFLYLVNGYCAQKKSTMNQFN